MAASFVQSKGAQNSSGTTLAITFTNPLATGNVIAIYTGWLSLTLTLNSVAQSAGTATVGSFTLLDNPTTASVGSRAAQGYAIVTVGGTCTITCTYSGTSFRDIIVHELTGVDTTTVLDNNQHSIHNQSNPGTGTDAIATSPITTTVNGDYIFVVSLDGNAAGTTFTQGTGFLNRQTQTGSGYNIQSEDQVQTSAGSITGTFTGNQAFSSDLNGIMAFLAAPSGDVDTFVTTSQLQVNIS